MWIECYFRHRMDLHSIFLHKSIWWCFCERDFVKASVRFLICDGLWGHWNLFREIGILDDVFFVFKNSKNFVWRLLLWILSLQCHKTFAGTQIFPSHFIKIQHQNLPPCNCNQTNGKHTQTKSNINRFERNAHFSYKIK